MSQTIDEQFVEYIVKTIVGDPDSVSIERTIDEKGVLLELTVNPDDLGRVIGRRGMTAQSIRTLLRALGVKNDARYNLKIIDNNPPKDDKSSMIADDSDKVASSDDSSDEEDTSSEDESTSNGDDSQEEESMVSKKRKEIEELADLDI